VFANGKIWRVAGWSLGLLVVAALWGHAATPAAQEPASKPVDDAKQARPQQPRRQNPRSDAADLLEIRRTIDRFRTLSVEIEDSSTRKTELESQLDELKRREKPAARGNGLLRSRELEALQAQLHRLTQSREGLIGERRELAGQILENAQRWRQTLNARLRQENLPETAARGAWSRQEIQRRLMALDSLTKEARRFSPQTGAPGGGLAWLANRPAPTGARGGNVEAQIRRLEREQEILQNILRQNEAALQRLRSQQALLQDHSELGAVAHSELLPQDDSSSPLPPIVPVQQRVRQGQGADPL